MQVPTFEPEFESPNLIPMIDILLVLLIFFFVAARISNEEREVSVRLAQVAKAQPLSMPPGEVVVNVTERGDFVVVGQALDERALAAFLRDLAIKNPGTQTVQIRCDDRAAFRYPARVMGLCEMEKIGHYCTVMEEKN
jgi:biopolymer transport protein ExbD